MKFELKRLSKENIPRALERAERYRLLNEPEEAESICLDILEVDPENQAALIALLLALTDQFSKKLPIRFKQALEILGRLSDEYQRLYYEGIIYERRGKVHLSRTESGSGHLAFEWFSKALQCYEKAARIRPPDNEDAILRWNTCVRMIENHRLSPAPQDTFEPFLE